MMGSSKAWERACDLDFGPRGWEQARLPLRSGGVAVGTAGPRAAAAYLTAWTRTQPELLRRIASVNMQGLRHADAELDCELTAASEDLQRMGVPRARIPFEEGGVGARPVKQKQLVDYVHKHARQRLFDLIDDGKKGRIRSASGAGSASFMMLPTQQDHNVESNLFRAAVAKRLGGRVEPKAQGTAQPVCCLISREGRCGGALDVDGIHANQCKCGGFVG